MQGVTTWVYYQVVKLTIEESVYKFQIQLVSEYNKFLHKRIFQQELFNPTQ